MKIILSCGANFLTIFLESRPKTSISTWFSSRISRRWINSLRINSLSLFLSLFLAVKIIVLLRSNISSEQNSLVIALNRAGAVLSSIIFFDKISKLFETSPFTASLTACKISVFSCLLISDKKQVLIAFFWIRFE